MKIDFRAQKNKNKNKKLCTTSSHLSRKILGFGRALGYHLEMSVVRNEYERHGWCLLSASFKIFVYIPGKLPFRIFYIWCV